MNAKANKLIILALFWQTALLAIPYSQAQENDSDPDELQAYNDCLAQEAREQYQLAYEECMSQGMGSDIEGGCETIAGVKSLEYESSIDYDCESLKPYKEPRPPETEMR